jgi:hypothetical protein
MRRVRNPVVKQWHSFVGLEICLLVWFFGLSEVSLAQELPKLTVAYSSRSIAPPIAVSRVFDFSLQEEVNRELGIR